MSASTSQANPAQSPPPSNNRRPEIFVKLENFWSRVTEGLELNQLWSQFKSDARASYRLYSRDLEARAPERSWRHKFLYTLQEFSWAILEKLSPARRILLLLAVVLLIFPGGGFSYHGRNGEVSVGTFDSHFYAGLVLLLLLMLEIADRVVMKRDLQIARDIQSWLLPAKAPPIPGLTISFSTRPANTVAGDYYDVFARAGGVVGEPSYLITVADVAGKSIPAALLMATFQASLRTLSATPCTLGELVTGMNHYACANSQAGLRFTTAFMAEFEPDSRTLTYVNAGHNPPILRRAAGLIEHLNDGGLPLGIQDPVAFETGRVILEPGDWLVIYTDGLVEAINANEQEYGEERLLAVLNNSAGVSPDDLLRRIMFDVDIYVGTTPQHDDITCMLIKVG